MRLFKKYDPLIALVLAISVGAFLYGFSVSGLTFAQRLAWEIWGAGAFLEMSPRFSLADSETRWIIVGAFFAVLAALYLFRLYRGLQFPHKRRILTGFVAVVAGLMIFYALMPAPEDPARAGLPADFKNGMSFDVSLNVPEHRFYYIDLEFNFRNATERKIASGLVGEAFSGCQQTASCGLTTQVDVTVKDSEGRLVPDRIKTLFGPHGRYAFGSGSYSRNLGTLPLRPGQYILTIRAVNVDERIHSAPVDLFIHPDPRGGIITGRLTGAVIVGTKKGGDGAGGVMAVKIAGLPKGLKTMSYKDFFVV